VATALQLAQNALRCHLALEVLDRTLNAFVADLDLERPALNRFAGIRQGAVGMTDPRSLGKPRSTLLSLVLPFFRMEPQFKPTGIKAPHGARIFEVTWADGQTMAYPHEILRGYCPCAGCQGHSGSIKFQTGGNEELREIERVGNYALSFTWGDSHSSGIYTFRYLRALGEMLAAQGPEAVKALGELPRT